MEMKKLYMFEAMTNQKPEGYCTCEMGYLIDQRLFNCQFYVTFLERDAVINIIKPALDEGREVIIGDADNKEYTIPPSLYEKGFRRSKEDYYKKIGDTLKKKYINTSAWIISSDMNSIKTIGLKTSKKIKLFNGALECKLLKYDLYKGSKKTNKPQSE